MNIEGGFIRVTLHSPGRVDLFVEVFNNSSKGKREIRSHEGEFRGLSGLPL